VININIKSGTNSVHGDIFEYLQNRDLDANVWQNNLVGHPEEHSFRISMAAHRRPIIRNKLFIFGDYQGTNIAASSAWPASASPAAYIPTPQEVQGNFSGLLGASGTSTDVNGNPSTSRRAHLRPGNDYRHLLRAALPHPFSGNIIPMSRMDPAYAKMLALFPAPNQPYSNGPPG